MESEKFCEKYFDIKISTLNFVLLNIVTVGLYWIYWACSLCKSINKYFGVTKIHPALPLALAITWASMWIFIIAALLSIVANIQHITVNDFRDSMYIVKNGPKFFALIMFPLSAFIAFKANKCVVKMLADQGIPLQIAGRNLSIGYLYYTIFNAEERYAKLQIIQGPTALANTTSQSKGNSRISQLENLAKLRDTGSLTEEEFQAEKGKILSQ